MHRPCLLVNITRSLTACLKSPQSQQKLERLIISRLIINHHIPTSKDGVNTLAFEMEEIILHTARKSLKIKKTKFRNKITITMFVTRNGLTKNVD
jgi:hypothetical protein